MAKEYQRTSGGTLQWRDIGAGVQGWNNIERGEESAGQGSPASAPADDGRRDDSGNRIYGSPAAAPNPSPATAGPIPSSPASSTPMSLGGIQSVTMPGSSGATAGGGGLSLNIGSGAADPMGIQGSTLGTLRSLGRRTPPNESGALAGIRRIY